MTSLIQMIVAIEVLLLPAWVGAVMVRPPTSLAARAARAPAAVVLTAAVLVALAVRFGRARLIDNMLVESPRQRA